jgi:alkylation response protein AidB-like acyl-CoA dehydrogenase
MLTEAQRIADEVLFPAAMQVDAADGVPKAHLDVLADAGFYGVATHVELDEFCSIIEALAGGCLATTFIWIQHHGLVRALAMDEQSPLRAEWLQPLCSGERRAGIALAGLIPGPPKLRARPSGDGGWVIEGSSPWVSGWGLIDVLQVAARGPDETMVWMLVDAVEQTGLTARRQRLVAVDASATVELDFTGLEVNADRVLRVEPFDAGAYGFGGGLRVNGSLSLGLVGRCCRLMGESRFDDELVEARQRLDQASPDEMPAARAQASELAARAATALVVHTGSRSILRDQHPQRLAREAMFLLVFGSRPAIREQLLTRLSR